MTIDWTINFSDVLFIGGTLVAAMFAVIRIEITTAALKDAIKNLTCQVANLALEHHGHNQEVGKIRERLAVVEDRIQIRVN